jgi:hypothetical protein
VIVLDDNIEDHPKFAGLSNDAFALWIRCLGYCRRQVTDGFVPVTVVHARARVSKPSRPVGELLATAPGCRNPLWHEVPGGYQFHDYTDWNPSKEDVEAKLAGLREKGRKGGLKSGQVRSARSQGEPEPKQPASTKLEAASFVPGSTQTNPGPVRSGPVRSEGEEEATSTTRGRILAELRRHPRLALVAFDTTAADIEGQTMSGLRVDDALEAIKAVAFDIADGSTEVAIRRALRGYLAKAKTIGDERRAKAAAEPTPTTLRKGIEAPDLRMKLKTPEAAS